MNEEILQELKEIKKLLQVIVSNQEQNREKQADALKNHHLPFKF